MLPVSYCMHAHTCTHTHTHTGVHSSGESLSEKASMVSVASTGSSRSSEVGWSTIASPVGLCSAVLVHSKC